MFKKEFDGGFQIIFIHYQPYSDGAYLEYNLGIRNHKVEQMIHQFLPSVNNHLNKSITLVQTLDKIGKELPRRVFIRNSENLSQTIMSVEKFFVSMGFKWLDDMSDPLKLEAAFASRKNKKFKTQNFIYNAFRGTALSKVYNPKDKPNLKPNICWRKRKVYKVLKVIYTFPLNKMY